MTGTRYSLEVQPRIPAELSRLDELANDLLYSWDRQVRSLFFRLDRRLWDRCGHNPKVFLRRISQQRLQEAAVDRIFMEEYNRVLSGYDTYRRAQTRPEITEYLDPEKDRVAYFCAEFGVHESLPLYSGGLGILAGDHCKAASDLNIPFVAVGILYRQGYFTQTIDGEGNQIAHYTPTRFADLPIAPVCDASNCELRVTVELPGREVKLRPWRATVGHIELYLLDSDLPENADADRSITYQLYGGDSNTRIQQEIVLGVGGVRLLRTLGIAPTVWHINEGHAAFQILERCRERVAKGTPFDTAFELEAAGTVFTTHTPVAAGHDIFDHGLMETYFGEFAEDLGLDMQGFLRLGVSPVHEAGFNMTALALRGSRFCNGVSRIHGQVAAQMEGYVWPEVPDDENPLRHVTNGVHVPTFLAREWANLFDMRFGGEWRSELLSETYWHRIDDIPDHSFWSLRQSLKSELLEDVRQRSVRQHRRNGTSEAQIERLTRHLEPTGTDILTIGFARRFATYKRATLLFTDPERLARLVNDPERPVVIIFAGKAHPSDQPGQHLIQVVHDFSRRPEFEGKIIMVENYDIALARKLVTGVDVWLNTPEYPLEASGTSGQKAAINGVVNLSVLDGWWGEGYNGDNGWAITPHGQDYEASYRNREEANELMDLLESQVVPLYYDHDGRGFSRGWVSKSKAAMKSAMPRFNAQRMVMGYVRDYYGPAARQQRWLNRDSAKRGRALARWKQRIHEAWPKVGLHRVDEGRTEITSGEHLPIRVAAQLNGLSPDDVYVECLVGTDTEGDQIVVHERHALQPSGAGEEAGETVFELDLAPALSGLQFYKIRMVPIHPDLSHPFETGYMVWL